MSYWKTLAHDSQGSSDSDYDYEGYDSDYEGHWFEIWGED